MSDSADDFAKWQKEISKADENILKNGRETDDHGDIGEMPEGVETSLEDRPVTPPDGEEEFIDDDGTMYKWDHGLRAWVPQVNIWISILFLLSIL